MKDRNTPENCEPKNSHLLARYDWRMAGKTRDKLDGWIMFRMFDFVDWKRSIMLALSCSLFQLGHRENNLRYILNRMYIYILCLCKSYIELYRFINIYIYIYILLVLVLFK